MSEVPTKPGWWVWSEYADGPKSFVRVFNCYRDELHFEEIGRSAQRQLDQGHFHHEVSLDKPASPRIPDPDEPRAEPTGGLTDAEIIEGSIAYDETYTAFDPTLFPMRDWNRLARQSGVAAFRRAVAEMREAGK